MKKASSNALTEAQSMEVQALLALRDEYIDTNDIPEVVDWTGAKRGLLYKPVKRELS